MLNDKKTVLKRNGRRVDFEGEKIGIAIKKAFEAVNKLSGKYTSEDANKVYLKVLDNILKEDKETVKVEEIQDIIEEELENLKYIDVKNAFSEYREKRAVSRMMYNDQKRNHKFLGVFEANINGELFEKHPDLLLEKRPEEIFEDFGGEITKKFSLSYILKRKIVDAVNSGEIYIKDIEYIPMKATSSVMLNLDEIMGKGFSTGIGKYRPPKNLMSYSALTYNLIESIKKEQSGIPGIPFFDKYFAKIFIERFKRIFFEYINIFLEFSDFKKFVGMNYIKQAVSKIESINVDINEFKKYVRDSNKVMEIINISYEKAIIDAQKELYNAVEALIHNLNNNIYLKKDSKSNKNNIYDKRKKVAINIGEEDSKEALIVSKTLLDVIGRGIGENISPIEPDVFIKITNKNLEKILNKLKDKKYKRLENKIYIAKDSKIQQNIFKRNEGIKEKINKLDYEDILIYSFSLLEKRKNISYSLFNIEDKEKNKKIETYFTKYLMEDMAIPENEVDSKKNSPEGRGLLSTTTINLPRLAIKSKTFSEFKGHLDEVLKLVFLQLFDRFNLQCDLDPKYFSILFMESVWLDTDKVKAGDRLRKVLKHGNMNVGIVGLYEASEYILEKYKDILNKKEDEKLSSFEKNTNISEKILKIITKYIDEFKEEKNVNLNIYADDEPSRHFMKLDKTLYGSIKGITDKEKYSKGTTFDENEKKQKLVEKLTYEGIMQKYTKGGNKTVVKIKNEKEILDVLTLSLEKNINLITFIFVS